jgi:small subunit ribosomal protein S17
MGKVRYGRRKTRVGVVVRDKMSKTVVVAVGAIKRHRLYKKIMRRVTRYKAHDEENACQVGDKVLIVETRPLSRDKRWRVAEILATAALPEEEKLVFEEEVAEELRELDEATAAEAPPAEEEAPPTEEVVAEEEQPAAAEEIEEAPQAEEEEKPAAEEEPEAEEEEQQPAEEEQAQAEEGEQPEEEETQES